MHSHLFSPARLPKKPYCSNDKTASCIRPVADALANYEYIQPNPPGLMYWLVLDIDRPDSAARYDDVLAPTPNIVVLNPASGRGHYYYALATPVCTSTKGRAKPQRYAKAIYSALAEKLGADYDYVGLMAKNPLHPSHYSLFLREKPYELAELAECLDLSSGKVWQSAQRRQRREANNLGRNCTIFDNLRAWAYQWVGTYRETGDAAAWSTACRDQAAKINDFPGHLDGRLSDSEIKATAKSVARWTWSHYMGTGGSDPEFLALQSARGALKGWAKRGELMPRVLELHAAGKSNKFIAKDLGLSAPTVANWLQRGAPLDAPLATVPAPATQRKAVTPKASRPAPPPMPSTEIRDMSAAEEKAWLYFELVTPGQREFWTAVWYDSEQTPTKRDAIPWHFPLALLDAPDECVSGERVPAIDVMVKRVEANFRACGRPLPW